MIYYVSRVQDLCKKALQSSSARVIRERLWKRLLCPEVTTRMVTLGAPQVNRILL